MFIFSSMAALTYPFVYVCRHARPEEPLRNTVSVFSLPSVSTAGAVVEVLKNGISLFCAFNHFSFDGLTRTFQIIQCSIQEIDVLKCIRHSHQQTQIVCWMEYFFTSESSTNFFSSYCLLFTRHTNYSFTGVKINKHLSIQTKKCPKYIETVAQV